MRVTGYHFFGSIFLISCYFSEVSFSFSFRFSFGSVFFVVPLMFGLGPSSMFWAFSGVFLMFSGTWSICILEFLLLILILRAGYGMMMGRLICKALDWDGSWAVYILENGCYG